MLELRPNCEHCDCDLPPEDPGAHICSYECTFCAACAQKVFKHICPNCGGNLVKRPIRPPDCLKRDPASPRRVLAAR